MSRRKGRARAAGDVRFDDALYGEDLAYVHHVGFGGFSRAAAPAILAYLHSAGIDSGLVVDLGCGSGVLARALTSTGYTVHGIDVSPSMLRLARQVAPRASFHLGSIATATLPSCDAVLSIGEGVGYLPVTARRAPPLRSLFGRVAAALRPGGLFIFDLLVGDGAVHSDCRTWHAGDDWAALVDVRVRGTTLTRQITTFREVNGRYRRSQERHVAGLYRRDDVVRRLSAEGFTVRVRRRYGVAHMLKGRLAFIALRR